MSVVVCRLTESHSRPAAGSFKLDYCTLGWNAPSWAKRVHRIRD